MHPLKWQIDPTKSAMWNLWDAVHVAVYFLCAEYGRKVKMTEEEWSDFKQTVAYNSVCAFLNNKIGPRNSYSHKHSFYQNVYSVVWSRFYRDLVAFQNKWVKPKMTSIDRLETNGTVSPDFQATLLKPIPRYLRTGERVLCRQDLKSWKSQTTNYFAVKHRQEELEADIEEDRLALFGENYKPTDWAALRAKRDSLRAERLKNENTDCNTCEGTSGRQGNQGGRTPHSEHAPASTKPVRKTKRCSRMGKGTKR